jgi:hypothetical protein
VVVGSDHGFTFDSVLDSSKSQLTCFTTCAAPLLASVFEGYNATILAYGQTGSGKTYTMGTGNVIQTAGSAVDDNVGIVPRVISRMFEEIETRKASQPDAVFAIRVQFLELYGDDLRDLLFPNPVGKPLAIREDEHGTMQVRELACSCPATSLPVFLLVPDCWRPRSDGVLLPRCHPLSG